MNRILLYVCVVLLLAALVASGFEHPGLGILAVAGIIIILLLDRGEAG